MPESLEPLWTRHDVARYLNVHANTVDDLCKRHGLPRIKIGGTVRFSPSAVREWLTLYIEVCADPEPLSRTLLRRMAG